ncbi:putative ABC transport system substrate-binding protein [Rhodoligotrophos appendicifer]|uniref:ABC transporter substrate-binding protein n=1 Tax=Rhodoligotrophos appendicifer TaxID=987056 RepID=UPI00117CB0ED|nr:ABC transporter substrate-binding protein [Rhodoligotrophos appendicifer]
MKRRHFLGLSLAASASILTASAHAQTTSAAPKRIYRITYRGRTAVEEGFDDYLAANGAKVEFIERDAQRDPSKIPGFVQEIHEMKPDLVYTWGTPVTLGTAGRYDAAEKAKYITEIPIVFALVSAPVQAGIVKSTEHPGRNVTGAVHVVPTETQLRAMESYRPFKKLGVLYSLNEQNSVSIVEDLKKLQGKLGFELIERTFRMVDGKPVADGIPELIAEIKAAGADWLYLLPDTFLGTQYSVVAPAALSEKLPTFGAAELAIREGGALVALVARYYSVGQLAASKALKILEQGIPPEDIPIETLKRFSLIINMPVAKQLELYPPIEMLNYAEVLTS